MSRKPLPPHVLELRGAFIRHPERRPPPSDEERLPTTRLAEARHDVAEPAPATVQDPRGVRLWTETLAQMIELGTATRETICVLERYVLMHVSLWKAAESGKPVRAALSRELSSLEARLLAPQPDPQGRSNQRRRVRPDNPFAQIARARDEDDALRKADPAAWQERCRRAAADAVALAARLRTRPDERRRILERKT